MKSTLGVIESSAIFTRSRSIIHLRKLSSRPSTSLAAATRARKKEKLCECENFPFHHQHHHVHIVFHKTSQDQLLAAQGRSMMLCFHLAHAPATIFTHAYVPREATFSFHCVCRRGCLYSYKFIKAIVPPRESERKMENLCGKGICVRSGEEGKVLRSRTFLGFRLAREKNSLRGERSVK
jgi:hypothetical protein